MSALPQSTRRKLSLLELAEQLGNVSNACQIMGYHRDSFYEIRRAFQVGGVSALVEQKRGPRNPHPNRVAPEVEEMILDYASRYPTHGQQRVPNELRLQNVPISPAGCAPHGCVTTFRRGTSGSCASSATLRRPGDWGTLTRSPKSKSPGELGVGETRNLYSDGTQGDRSRFRVC